MIGTGMGLVNVPSLLIVGIYFKRKLNLAHGLVMIGSCTGQLIFVTLFAYLNTTYGWRGTLLILAGLSANVMVCGAVFRPLKKPPSRTWTNYSDNAEVELGAAGPYGKKPNNVSLEESDVPDYKDFHDNEKISKRSFDALKHLGTVSAINICITIPMLALYQICTFLVGAAIFIPLVHLVNKAVISGTSKENAAMLATIIGAGNILSRGGYGWFVDNGYISAHTLFLIATLFCAVETMTFVLTDIYSILAVLCFLYGIHFGILAALSFIIPRLLVTQEQVPPVIGLTYFVHSMGNVTGSVLAGWLYDITGSYTSSFVTCAGIYALAAIFFLPIYCFLSKQHNLDQSN
ncbi:monocarboxylate transporter 3-like [Amphiura filiformis]|uniref:monocarboxylate transporter 3-like n=1 Tax=Amphiura filiformis TaxID=82378 RepID=UPI003B22886D